MVKEVSHCSLYQVRSTPQLPAAAGDEERVANDHYSMWFLYFVNAFQSSILTNLVPYATSDFESHSLLTVIYIVANAMTAAVYIPLAKLLDVWGRAEGFLLMIAFATLGLVLMASVDSLSTFCAAQVGGTPGCSQVVRH